MQPHSHPLGHSVLLQIQDLPAERVATVISRAGQSKLGLGALRIPGAAAGPGATPTAATS